MEVEARAPEPEVVARAPEPEVVARAPEPAVEAKCECEQVFCVLSFPEGCYCQNAAAETCAKKCGTKATLQVSPTLIESLKCRLIVLSGLWTSSLIQDLHHESKVHGQVHAKIHAKAHAHSQAYQDQDPQSHANARPPTQPAQGLRWRSRQL